MNDQTNTSKQLYRRAMALIAFLIILTAASSLLRADTGTCNGQSLTLPFTDVPSSNIFFCSIAAAYFTGLTAGTSATTYSPAANVTREQMAAFITRTLDQSLKRGSKRAALQQWWGSSIPWILSPDYDVDDNPAKIASDGADLWVACPGNDAVTRMRASDCLNLGSYSLSPGPDPDFNPHDILAIAGHVFVTSLQGPGTPGRVYRINPRNSPGNPSAVTLYVDDTGPNPTGITFDGIHLWTANNAGGLAGGSISRLVAPGVGSTTFTAGFMAPADILWDGENLWVADFAADRVRRVDPQTGAVLQSIVVGDAPRELLFDGANLWVSNFFGDSVTVIRAVGGLRGTVLATLTGNGLDAPAGLAFDGERVLVTNLTQGSVSLFKAVDFMPLGNLFTGVSSNPVAACSDGLNFWIVRQGLDDIVRF